MDVLSALLCSSSEATARRAVCGGQSGVGTLAAPSLATRLVVAQVISTRARDLCGHWLKAIARRPIWMRTAIEEVLVVNLARAR